jgi:hypothetical protein
MDFPLDELKRLFDRKAATDALRGVGRYAKGVGESAIDIGGGMAGQAIGGLNALVAPTEREASRRVEAGARTGEDLSRLVRSGYGGLSSILRGEGLQRAAQEVQGTKESGPEAQELQGGMERIFKPAQEGAQWLGEQASDQTGMPFLGAMVATAGEAATQLDLPGLKGAKSPAKAAKRAAITDILRGERAPVVPREEWGPRFYSPLDTLLADPKVQFKPVPPEGLANWLAKNGINAEEILDRKLTDFIERKQKTTETSRISEEFFTKQLNDRYQEARAAGNEAEMARLQERIAEHKATVKENRANSLVTLEDLRTHASNNPMSDFEVNLVDDSRHKKQLQKEWEGLQEGVETPRDPATLTEGEQARRSHDPTYETDSRQHGVVDQRLVVEGNKVTDPVTGHTKEFPDSRLNEREMRDATIREIMSWDRDPTGYDAPLLPFDDPNFDSTQAAYRDRAWDRHDDLQARLNDAENRLAIEPYDDMGNVRTEAMIDELRRSLPEEQVRAAQEARERFHRFTEPERGRSGGLARQRYSDIEMFPDELAKPKSNAPSLPNKFTGNSLGYNYTTAGHKKSTYYPALKDFLGEPEVGTSMQNVTISHPDMGNWVPVNESLHGEVMGHPAGDKMYAYTRNEVRRVVDPETGELTPAMHVDESQSDPYNKGRIKGFKGEVQTDAIKNAPDKYRGEMDAAKARKREISDRMDAITGSGIPDPYQTPEYKALETEFTGLETRISVLRDNLSGAQNRVDYGGSVPYIPGLKNYPNVLSRLNLRLAAENGLDLVSMATGEENAARWPGASHAPGLVNLYNKGFIPTMAGEMRRLESEAGGKAGPKDLAHTTTPGRDVAGTLNKKWWSSPFEDGVSAVKPEKTGMAAKAAVLRSAVEPTPVKTRAGKVSKQAQALALRRGMSPYLIPLGLGLEGLLGDDEQ